MNNILKELLIKNNRTEKYYGQLVSKYVRERYTENDVEAILNNYLNDMTNEKYKAEFDALQVYRNECKQRAKAEMGIVE